MIATLAPDDFMNPGNFNGMLRFLQGSYIKSKVLWRSRGKFRLVVKVERGASWWLEGAACGASGHQLAVVRDGQG